MPPNPNWIEHLVKLHEEFESPLNFWRWGAMAAISAVAKDSVWLDQHIYKLYPNIYVMFHADSGLKKGPPVNMAKRLVKKVDNTRVISGRSSIQGILRKLGTAESQPGGKVKKGSTAFICSSELSSSIVDDKAATDILTDLYDRSYNADDWGSLLKSEEFSLKDATITMLTATNEAHSSKFFERKDVAGGFFARTFIIYENEENRSNSLLEAPETLIDDNELIKHLVEISRLKGQFRPLWSREETEHHTYQKYNEYKNSTSYLCAAGKVYEDWYVQFKKDAKGVKDPTGTLNRFGASVLKVAMILSLAESVDLVISASAMEQAIEHCEKLVGNIRKITFGRAESDVTDAGRKKLVLMELLNREGHSISRDQLQKKYWMQGTYKEWDETMMSLDASKIVELEPSGNQILYRMSAKAVAELTQHFKGKAGQ